MIRPDEITQVGAFIKPHGIKGELSATFDVDDFEPEMFSCIITDIDGIFVPFFIESSRRKSHSTLLLTIDDVDSDVKAKDFSGKQIYVLTRELPNDILQDDADGFYASDLIGYTITETDGSIIGEITDFDDSTENVVLMVSRENEDMIYVPLADEFFVEINPESKQITMTLPSGILDL